MNKVLKTCSIQACVCILLVTTVLTMAQDLSTIPSDTDDAATARDSFSVDNAQQATQSDTVPQNIHYLDDHYNLGRLTGSVIRGNLFLDVVLNDDVTTYEGFPTILQFGTEDVTQFRMDAATEIYTHGDLFLMRLHSSVFAGTIRPTPGQRVYMGLSQSLTWLYLESYENESERNDMKSGFTENSKYFSGYLGHTFLSQDGQIQQKANDYQLSFLYGPLLNQGQLQNTILLRYQFLDSLSFQQFYLNPSLGLTDEINLHFLISNAKASSSYYKTTAFAGEFRHQNTRVTVSDTITDYQNPKDHWLLMPSGLSQTDNHLFNVNIAQLIGSRDLSLANVAGNWDHYFNPILGKSQLLLNGNAYFLSHDISEARRTKNSEGKDSTYYVDKQEWMRSLNINAAYGITAFFTSGLAWDYQYVNKTTTSAFHVQAAFSNVPLRTQGPRQVTPLEYDYGYVPKKNQFYITLSSIIPVLLDASYQQSFGHPKIDSLNKFYEQDPLEIENADLLISADYGFTDRVVAGFQYAYFHGGKAPGYQAHFWTPKFGFFNERTGLVISLRMGIGDALSLNPDYDDGEDKASDNYFLVGPVAADFISYF